MNRKDRRAAQKQGQRAAASGATASGSVAELRAQAIRHQQQGRLDDAATLYRRALTLTPDDAAARNDFACLLLAQGRLTEAATQFQQVVLLTPELFDSYADIVGILTQVNPALREAIGRASHAWPALLPAEQLLGPAGLEPIASDPLLRSVLECSAVRDIHLERLMTALRATLLDQAANGADEDDVTLLGFAAALAKQCFINEYVFAMSDAESGPLQRLQAGLADALAASEPISPLRLLAVAAYGPLASWPGAASLLGRAWPPAVDDVLTQQLREPQVERELRSAIPRLTPIDDTISLAVQRQYEENPYPRWVMPPSRPKPVSVEDYLRQEFPHLPAGPAHASGAVDVLVAGCGTGLHSVGVARRFKETRLTAIDLSLASLGYALRKTRELGLDAVNYAQADILELGSIGHSFDLIEAGGVLHHLADPFAGWRVLLGLLRPGGVMRVALYSEIARRDVVAARALIAEQGYRPTADDIRRCRQALLASPLCGVARYYDFFSTSECRDLMFHVQEHRLDIPAIATFLTETRTTFIGFELDPQTRGRYRTRFPDDSAMLDLGHWHVFETENPATFASMYQFWLRKA